ncbi:VOC family protein [Nocardioides sp. NPDC047086]|uniref:VOC family protein n=1 Tax=Nocardioides sp. NPDC047086 TaxID=3154810 RepID=UPI0033C242D6
MVDLFAGIPVTSITDAVPWYEKLLGEAAFHPNEVEVVFEAAEHRYVYIEQKPDIAGHGFVTLFVDDLDARLVTLADRGLRPASEETYENGVRKIVFRDPDGNEIGIGGGPAAI